MITSFKKFKLFENNDNASNELLTDFLDDGYICEYYENNYLSKYNTHDIENLIEEYPNILVNNFNDERYINDLNNNINLEIDTRNYDDESDYIDYLTEHMTEQKEKKIMNFYYSDNEEDMTIKTEYDGIVSIDEDERKITITEDGVSESYDIPNDFNIVVEDYDEISSNDIIAISDSAEYDYTMLNELDIEQLKDIIMSEYEEVEFVKFANKKRNEGKTFLEIMEDIHGINGYDELVGSNGIYTTSDFISTFSRYINDDKLVSDFKKMQDTDFKYSWFQNQIDNSIEIQQYLMDNADDPHDRLTLVLYDLFEDKGRHSDDISNEYDFQKRYIEQYVKEYGYDDNTEEENGDLIADALKNLNDKFGLDSDIKKEFNKYMFSVDAEKFNI